MSAKQFVRPIVLKSMSTRRLTYWRKGSRVRQFHFHLPIEILNKFFPSIVYEDPEPSADETVNDLEQENMQLRSKISALERELGCRSPSRMSRLRGDSSKALCRENDIENALRRMDNLKLADKTFSPASAGSSPPKRKQKKMATRRWDFAPEDEI